MKEISKWIPFITPIVLFVIITCKDHTPEQAPVKEDSGRGKIEQITTPVPRPFRKPEYHEDIGFVTTESGLTLRVAPSINSEKVAVLPLFTMVVILDMNGPTETLHGLSGKWHKAVYREKTGWLFGPLLTVLNNSLVKREKPDFSDMTLRLHTEGICCGCGPYYNMETIIFKNGKVLSKKKHGDELTEELVQEGDYSVNGDDVIIHLSEGTMYYSPGDGTKNLSPKKAPERKFSIKWHDGIRGFITGDMKKNLNAGKYYVNMRDCQFVMVKSLVAYDLCVRTRQEFFLRYVTADDDSTFTGYYCGK